MGNWFSRKVEASAELEQLSQDIQNVENHIDSLMRRQSRVERLFSFIAFFLSTACAAITIFSMDLPLYSYWVIAYFALPLILAYLLQLVGRKPIGTYYTWRIGRRQTALDMLVEKKEKLLENVRKTETYNVAKELLEKYGSTTDVETSSECSVTPPKPMLFEKATNRGDVFDQTSLNLSLFNKTKTYDSEPENENDATMVATGDTTMLPLTPRLRSPFKPRTHRPFYPESKSSVDRLLDYMCGDGINKRYALICGRCHTHNGMSHIDEADHVAYHCYKCGVFNPARRSRNPSLGVDRLCKTDRSYSEVALNQASAVVGDRRLSSFEASHSMSEDIDLAGITSMKNPVDTIGELDQKTARD